ncbi:MAG: transposase [Clostridia bacterium]|nr:transposase [Clostridia bacterium]
MELPERKNVRLQDYDYSSGGAYFITLCTQNKKCLFEIENNIVGNDLRVVPYLQNRIIHKWIKQTENKFDNIKIDKYVIMPNHLHLIVVITERHAGRSLPSIMQFFKTMTTNEYISNVKNGNLPPFDKKLWQKTYYDHIIRDQNDYLQIWQYIDTNPAKWQEDKYYK